MRAGEIGLGLAATARGHVLRPNRATGTVLRTSAGVALNATPKYLPTGSGPSPTSAAP